MRRGRPSRRAASTRRFGLGLGLGLRLALALALVLAARPALAEQGKPCLSPRDCPSAQRCVRAHCVPPRKLWGTARPRIGLAVEVEPGACRRAGAAVHEIADRLALLLERAGAVAHRIQRSLDPARSRGLLDLLDDALTHDLRAVVTLVGRCPRRALEVEISASTLDVPFLRRPPELRWVFRRTVGAGAGPGDLELATRLRAAANRLVAVDGGPEGILGSRIAFACKLPGGIREIFSVRADGTDLRQETHFRSLTMLPAWAPGGRVAATTYTRDNPDIYVGDRPLYLREGLNTGVDFHLSSGRFVVAAEARGSQDIFLGDPKRRRLLRLTTHPGIDTAPAFSPDGRKVVFVSDRTGVPQIYRIDLRSRDLQRISSGATYSTSPAWSPDGRTLAWNRRRSGRIYDVVIADVEDPGGTLRLVTHGGASYEDPSFSPDGRFLVAAEIRDRRARPVLIDLATGSITALVSGELPGSCNQPAWSHGSSEPMRN